MKLEIYIFFEIVAFFLLMLTLLKNHKYSKRGDEEYVSWLIPLISTVIFGILMFTPIMNSGYMEIINKINTSDNLTYSYTVAESGSYGENMLMNFMFFLIAALYTIYSVLLTMTDWIEKRGP